MNWAGGMPGSVSDPVVSSLLAKLGPDRRTRAVVLAAKLLGTERR
jgi:hypothetical protein